MNSIQKLIEDVLGKYNEDVEKAIWGQIRVIIKETGEFKAKDWTLHIVRPDVTVENSMIVDGHNYVFSIEGAVKLVPKPNYPKTIKDDILVGGLVRKYKRVTPNISPNSAVIIMEGIQVIDMVDGNDLRFSFYLEIKGIDYRIRDHIESKLEY